MNIEQNLLIDRIVEFDYLSSIVCQSTIPHEAEIFKGHFPGNPIVPGVLLIEMMAQASGYIHMLSNNFEKMLYLASVRSAKFKNMVVPGDDLIIKSRIIHEGDGYIVTKAKLLDVSSGVIATSELMLKLEKFFSKDIKNHIIKRVENNKGICSNVS